MIKHVWTNPKGNRNKVVILTDEALLLANPEPAQLGRFQAAFDAGEVRTALLAENMQVIPLGSMLKLQSNRERSQIQIVHGYGSNSSNSLAQFDELGTRDDAFESLRQALGNGFRVAQRETGKLKSGWQPLLKAFAVATLAVFLRGSAAHASRGAEQGEFQEGLLIFGPGAITVVALGLIAYFLRDFYRRTQHVGPLLELIRD